MKVYFERKVLAGFLLALTILVVLGIYSYKNSKDSMKTSQMISHTNAVLYHIEQLHSSHLELEAELIRYSINADSSFATFFRSKLKDAATHYTTLRESTKDNPRQQKNLDSIQKLGRKKVDLIKLIINARLHSMDSVRILIPSSYNDQLIKDINAVVEDMLKEEQNLLNKRMETNQEDVQNFNSTFILLVAFAAIVLIILFITINANLHARLKAERALKWASEEISDLYNNAPCGYHSLNKDGIIIEMNKTCLNWIGRRRDEVINKLKFSDLLTPKSRSSFERKFSLFKSEGVLNNTEFEIIGRNGDPQQVILNSTAIVDDDGNFIKSRSTVFDITDRYKAEQKVATTNKELEAFTYSVSHDLRAPLRSIDGYSKILQEDYAVQMDDEAGRLIEIVRKNARRMGQLIDDLLDFSRLGRKELTPTIIHMNTLVDNIRQELLALEKDREIQFIVHPLQDIVADFSMIRQVWVNVMANALKYSKKETVAKIELGCQDENSRVVYYIRDNGVGFDMKYVDKLFGVFQRLHKIEEFEGTGVGLALAHRIITRHGGKIWAEASVGEGATFYFFLPKANIN